MVTSGRHCIFFEADESRVLIVRVLHGWMDYRRHLGSADAPDENA
jgi:plasmid stabilization system protein ParE